MVTHIDIIERAGGPSALGRIVGASANTAKAWKRTGSIPAPFWAAIAEADIASLDELAGAVDRRRLVGAIVNAGQSG